MAVSSAFSALPAPRAPPRPGFGRPVPANARLSVREDQRLGQAAERPHQQARGLSEGFLIGLLCAAAARRSKRGPATLGRRSTSEGLLHPELQRLTQAGNDPLLPWDSERKPSPYRKFMFSRMMNLFRRKIPKEDEAAAKVSGRDGEGGAKKEKRREANPDALKDTVRQGLLKPAYDVKDFYKTRGFWQRIARAPLFDSITLGVIALNALWIGVDTDFNDASCLLTAAPIFQAADNFFCAYFFFEWVVRFNAFKRKRDCVKDTWFVFDSVLVFLMVMETWGMTAYSLYTGVSGSAGLGNATILRLFRLLRLSRMTRMVRLLRQMPELVILIKSMVAAIRSLVFTFLLLGVMLYVFGITFRQLVGNGTHLAQTYFSSLPAAMYSLLIHGTFLDNLSTVAFDIQSQSMVLAVVFWVFVVLSSLTTMNMLIGVLCEVVSSASATEREMMLVAFVKEKMQEFLQELDSDSDGQISADEFFRILEKPEACRILHDVGVDVVGLIDQVDIIFESSGESEEGGKKCLDFEELVELILNQRDCCTATVKDIIDLRKFVRATVMKTNKQVERVRQKLDSLPGFRPAAGGQQRPVRVVENLNHEPNAAGDRLKELLWKADRAKEKLDRVAAMRGGRPRPTEVDDQFDAVRASLEARLPKLRSDFDFEQPGGDEKADLVNMVTHMEERLITRTAAIRALITELSSEAENELAYLHRFRKKLLPAKDAEPEHLGPQGGAAPEPDREMIGAGP